MPYLTLLHLRGLLTAAKQVTGEASRHTQMWLAALCKILMDDSCNQGDDYIYLQDFYIKHTSLFINGKNQTWQGTQRWITMNKKLNTLLYHCANRVHRSSGLL